MDWALVAPMVTAIVLILTIGGVILLEERQDFTEELLRGGDRKELRRGETAGAGSGSRAADGEGRRR